MVSDSLPQEVSGARKAVKRITGFALLAGCLSAAMVYRNPAALRAGKFAGILGMSSELPPPFSLKSIDEKGACQLDSFNGGGETCHAPWVYCTDARCDSNVWDNKGVLVATCLCWMPQKVVNNSIDNNLGSVKESILPKTTSGP